jgi:hypothetical protein
VIALDHLLADSVRSDALQWFPKKSTIFGSIDARPPKGVTPQSNDTLRRMFAKELRDRDKSEMYAFAEKVGNFRIDRVSFAIIPDANQDDLTRAYIRVTGKGNPKRLADFLSQQFRGAKVKKQNGPSGEAITIIDHQDEQPAIALIGDTDMLACGITSKEGRGKQGTILDQALQVMAGKKDNLVKGPYGRTLKSAPARASGLLIGDLPERWTKVTGRGSPFQGFPQHFNVTMTRNAKGMKVRVTGSAANAKEAKAFVDSVHKLKQQGIDGLNKLPEMVKIEKKTIESMKAALKSIRMEAQDALLTGGVTISNETAKAGVEMMKWLFMGVAVEARGVDPKPKRE